MTPFLQTIAQQIIEKHSHELSELIIVVPGKRAGLFLRRYLARELGRSFLAPSILTLPDFVSRLMGKSTTAKLDLLLLLYNVYKQRMGANAESFDAFSKWGSTALSDFGDIEQALASGSSLFKDLRDIKEIENWSFNQNPLTETQNTYLEFWNQLGTIYSDFRDTQLTKEKYSYALLCNLAAKGTPAQMLDTHVPMVWFVGLSNLSKAESTIIRKLKDAGKATIRWDADHYYFDNPDHEAGDFLRRHSEKSDLIIGHDFTATPKDINIYTTTTPYSQALLIRDIIARFPDDDFEKTAIVVADSSLLIPLVKNLPQINAKINIALGYPLKQTSVMKLLKSLLFLHMPAPGKEKRGLYYKALLRVIEQQSLFHYIANDIKKIRTDIAKEKRIYIKADQFEEFVNRYPSLSKIKFLFSEENRTPIRWIQNVLLLIDELLIQDSAEQDEFETEALLRAQELLSEVAVIFAEGHHLEEMKSLQTIIQQLLAGESITFTGEPLEGLQILNMVETRAIDFEHIIVIGANEDMFPGNLSDQSLIPFDVRKLFELPVVKDKEATYAYTLYRLLQRASKIDFLHSSITSDFKGTEQSRYITQLELELPSKSSFATFKKINSSLSNQLEDALEVSIPNDDFSKERIKTLWANGISPSAINKYIQCPLDFYYRYILGLGEEEEIEENISASIFGSVVHDVLEGFFENYIDSFPTKEELQQFKERLDDELEKAFSRHYGLGDIHYGENYLQFSVAKKMLEKIIEFEHAEIDRLARENKKTRILEIEATLQATIPHKKYNVPFEMRIKGKADRIDEEAGLIRIIDYKTGKVDPKDVKLSDKTENIFDVRKSKLIQLLFYAYMRAQSGTAPENISVALFSLKNFKSGWITLETSDGDALSQKILDDFEHQLALQALAMFELDVFEHNEDSRYCEYCNR
jgi:CRISPR/Cas system-associated exonuclease Cas4 (RecB family)